MSIAWNYLDKRSAAMAALKDYCSMKAILATTAEEIANVRQDMVHIGGMRFEESAHGARNPQAGENQILHGIAEIDVLEERKRQAEEFMAWFQPAWDALGEDEKAKKSFHQLIIFGERHIFDKVEDDFFAVSLPELEVYQTDTQKEHDKYCCRLMELGQKGLEQMKK